MSSLPTPPMEDQKSHHIRKSSTKQSKPLNRTSKRSSSSHEHSAVVIDGRHKRVWKACERCRMKKTKVCRRSINILQRHNFLTNFSATESLLANVAKMMDWFAQLEAGKRLSSSNSLGGESPYSLISVAIRKRTPEHILIWISLDMPKSWKIHNMHSSQLFKSFIQWFATMSRGSWETLR